MTMIRFAGETYSPKPGESVLDCLLRQGHDIPRSCRSGVCRTCLMRAEQGAPPRRAQEGLRESLRERGYFHSCICIPEEDLSVALPGQEESPRFVTHLAAKESLAPDILRIILRAEEPVAFRAGQFITLRRPSDGLMRSYSLANVPDKTACRTLELHVRRYPGGRMSGWLHDEARIGDPIEAFGPSGECCYRSDDLDRPLLLIGTGTGLAPLIGIVEDALAHGHRGPVHLFHGSRTAAGLYRNEALQERARLFPTFTYTPCVSGDEGTETTAEGITPGRADAAAFARHPSLKGWRVYLCGHPDMVKGAKRKAFLAGASLADIYADPFVPAAD
jgi:ferredoxin-NADP reductase/ferredoxin